MQSLDMKLINNSRERYLFNFNGVLTPEAKQDEVFERVARPVVVSSMQGFHGTIFAYGQTGSGKTFTVTGGAERYVDRGIIPRTIACVYSEVAKQAGYTFQVHISYLEIYNEVGYDLLDPTREVQAMEDLPQVYIQEDEEQNIHFKNLSVHRAGTEEEALNLLFLGDTNRTISETPMNQASSRSHCIFSIMLEARQAGSDVVRRSKLHLVDLAGSERVAKSGVDGTTLKEAKHINLSLHYLEQVIIALQERSMGMARVHVPYRNSLMTLVLRDSLGGNCRTVMVATVSGEAQHMEESISTCRFAQRVALVRNEVSVNEGVDPAAIIRRLKQEVRDLKDELQLLKGGAVQRGPLTPDELLRLRQQLLAYVADSSAGASLNLGGDMMLIRASWQVFKQLLSEGRHGGSAASATDTDAASSTAHNNSSSSSGSSSRETDTSPDSSIKALQEQVRKLQLQVKQRDSEIAIMIGMVKGKSSSIAQVCPATATAAGAADAAAAGCASVASPAAAEGSSSGSGQVRSALLDARLLADRHAAFEVFRKSYRQGEVIEDNKQLLKAKYDQAKALGVAVNASKARINELRTQIEQWRMQRSAACVAEGRDVLAELALDDPRELQAKQAIEQEKASYKSAFSHLRDLKGEIEHLQLLLEQSRQKLQRDFQQWLGMVARQQQEHQQGQQGQQQQGQQQHHGKRSGADFLWQGAGVGVEPHQFQYAGDSNAQVVVYATGKNAAAGLAKSVTEAAAAAIKEKGSFTLVLSGGSLIGMLSSIADVRGIDFSKWWVFFVDERNVPLASADSNYKGAQDALLGRVGVPPSQVFAIQEGLSVQQAATNYEGRLLGLPHSVLPRTADGAMPVFDLILLGIGPDGHVASLFPNTPETAATSGWVLPVTNSPKPPPERITFTMPAINAAKEVAVVAVGESKAEVVQRALEVLALPGALPAQLVRPSSGKLRWVLDSMSAQHLQLEDWANGKGFPRNK
ncbi:kinesin family member 6 [Scenedesmus sp. NREL 46B-D3]|nr:kinesin family member 6 [Scenedesmus sp. NREL 46B-D3]